MERALALPAPAKLNLFLHVIGRRADGYHDLQSAFALIDLADWIDIEPRDDGELHRSGDLLGAPDDDLALRAARLLRERTGIGHGADIRVTKRIPAGAGLGGGSSDAATTLIALNRIWATALPCDRLSEIAIELGADVPFFVRGFNAFAEGRGERLTPLALQPAHYALIWPQVHVSTQEIFSDRGLTRNTKATKMSDFSAAGDPGPWRGSEEGSEQARNDIESGRGEVVARVLARFGANDLEAVARRRFPVIGEVLEHLGRFGPARMTGSGSAAFAVVADEAEARDAVAGLPPGWCGWAVRGLAEHPLVAWQVHWSEVRTRIR
ncbi:MAG TPA: 4-(cytidine 5'-diphospho)-2-C-methyl-D-erythritol kinase [Burkholderiaceae bacterium]|nr:4-(cytidine 5'-diphospho)-2-C-methyl-D-erythritol kinase [Burkholderiaceae bacterium]